jgi:hypothetical protein
MLAERRRTIRVVAVMFTVFVVAAILLDVFLPMGLDTREALIGMDGGIGAVTLTDGTAHIVLEAPPKGEGYAAWGLAPDRDRFVDVWYKTSGRKVEKASLQIRNASSGHLRIEYPIEPGPDFLDTVQVGYVPGEAAIWLLDSGNLSFLVYKTGELTEVTVTGSDDPLRMRSVCFSPDQRRLAYVPEVTGDPLLMLVEVPGLMVGDIDGTSVSEPYPLDPGSLDGIDVVIPRVEVPILTGPVTWVDRSTLIVVGTAPEGKNTVVYSVVPRGPGDFRWVAVDEADWRDLRVESLSASPDSKGCAFLVRSTGEAHVRIDWNSRPDPEPLSLTFKVPGGPLRWAPF